MSVYRVKHVDFGGRPSVALMQNENGPCPLLALANLLLARGEVCISRDYGVITHEQLLSLIHERILAADPQLPDDLAVHFKRNVEDAMLVLPALAVGMDINVRFKNIRDFEFTREQVLFDVLAVDMVHGWLADPQDPETFSVVSELSFNQMQEKLVELVTIQSSDEPPNAQKRDSLERDLIVQQFLQETQSQLTMHGLAELYSDLEEGRFAVFFRANHFSVLHKHDGELYTLVTDEGYTNVSNVVWEKLCEIDGDSVFVDSMFRLARLPSELEQVVERPELVPVDSQLETPSALQDERHQRHVLDSPYSCPPTSEPPPGEADLALSDEEFARRLQLEEYGDGDAGNREEEPAQRLAPSATAPAEPSLRASAPYSPPTVVTSPEVDADLALARELQAEEYAAHDEMVASVSADQTREHVSERGATQRQRKEPKRERKSSREKDDSCHVS